MMIIYRCVQFSTRKGIYEQLFSEDSHKILDNIIPNWMRDALDESNWTNVYKSAHKVIKVHVNDWKQRKENKNISGTN